MYIYLHTYIHTTARFMVPYAGLELLEVAKLLEGNALKFSDFEAEILEPDWGTTGHLCKLHSMLLVKIVQSLGNRNHRIICFGLVIIPALN